MKKPLTEKQRIERRFARILIKRMNDYTTLLGENNDVGDREYKHMASAILGCQRVVQGVYSSGHKYKVKLR